jgi:hypothetical protein
MKSCPKCGMKIRDNDFTCNLCGQVVVGRAARHAIGWSVLVVLVLIIGFGLYRLLRH